MGRTGPARPDRPTDEQIIKTIRNNTGGHGIGGLGSAPSQPRDDPGYSATGGTTDNSDPWADDDDSDGSGGGSTGSSTASSEPESESGGDPWSGSSWSTTGDDDLFMGSNERNDLLDQFVENNSGLVDTGPGDSDGGRYSRDDLVIREAEDGDGFLVGPNEQAVVREQSDEWIDSWISDHSDLIDEGPGDRDGGRFKRSDLEVRKGDDGSVVIGPSDEAVAREREEMRVEQQEAAVDQFVEQNPGLVDEGPNDPDGGLFTPDDISVRETDSGFEVGPSEEAIARERREQREIDRMFAASRRFQGQQLSGAVDEFVSENPELFGDGDFSRDDVELRTEDDQTVIGLDQEAIDRERSEQEAVNDILTVDDRFTGEQSNPFATQSTPEQSEAQAQPQQQQEQFGDIDWSAGLGDPDEDEVENFVDETIGQGGSEWVGDTLAGTDRYLDENPGDNWFTQLGNTNAKTLVGMAKSAPQAPATVLEGVELTTYLAGGTRIVSGDNQVFVDRADQTLDATERVVSEGIAEAEENPTKALSQVTGGAALGRVFSLSRLGTSADVDVATAARRATGDYADTAGTGASRAATLASRAPDISITRDPDAGVLDVDPMLWQQIGDAAPDRPSISRPDVTGTVRSRLSRAREGASNSAAFRRAAVADRIQTVEDALSFDSDTLVPDARDFGRRSKSAEISARLSTEAALASARDAAPGFDRIGARGVDLPSAREAGRWSKSAEITTLLSAEAAAAGARETVTGWRPSVPSRPSLDVPTARETGRWSKGAELTTRLSTEAGIASAREGASNWGSSLVPTRSSSGELTAARMGLRARELRADARAEFGVARDRLSAPSLPSFGSSDGTSIFDTTIRVGPARPRRTSSGDPDLADVDLDPDENVLGPFADDDPFDFDAAADGVDVNAPRDDGMIGAVRTKTDTATDTRVREPAPSDRGSVAPAVGAAAGVGGLDRLGEMDDVDDFGFGLGTDELDAFDVSASVDDALDGLDDSATGVGSADAVDEADDFDFDAADEGTATSPFDILSTGTDSGVSSWTTTTEATEPDTRFDRPADPDPDRRRRLDFDDPTSDPDADAAFAAFGEKGRTWDTGVAQSLDELDDGGKAADDVFSRF